MNVGYLPYPTHIYQLKSRHSNANIKLGNFNNSTNETNYAYKNNNQNISINIMHYFYCQTTMKMYTKEQNTNQKNIDKYVYLYILCNRKVNYCSHFFVESNIYQNVNGEADISCWLYLSSI